MRKYYKRIRRSCFCCVSVRSGWFMLLFVVVFLVSNCNGGGGFSNETNGNEAMFRSRISENLEYSKVERGGVSGGGVKRKELPEELLNEVWKLSERFEDVDDVERKQLKKFILHAKRASESICPHCIEFLRILPSIYRRVKSADLWIYLQYSTQRRNFRKNKKASVKIYTLSKSTHIRTLIARSDLRKGKEGWHKVIVNSINSWTTLHEHFIEVDALIEIVCSYCRVITEDRTLPYAGLVAELLINPTPSVRRCTVNTTTCCLDDFEIKLNKYIKPLSGDIIWPKVINVGACRGSCDDIHVGYHPHSALVSAVKLQGMKENKREGLCCVPKKYVSISTIIDEGQGFLVAKSIHDLVVDECTCA